MPPAKSSTAKPSTSSRLFRAKSTIRRITYCSRRFCPREELPKHTRPWGLCHVYRQVPIHARHSNGECANISTCGSYALCQSSDCPARNARFTDRSQVDSRLRDSRTSNLSGNHLIGLEINNMWWDNQRSIEINVEPKYVEPGMDLGTEEPNRHSASERCRRGRHRGCGLVDQALRVAGLSLFVPHHARRRIRCALVNCCPRCRLCASERALQQPRSGRRSPPHQF